MEFNCLERNMPVKRTIEAQKSESAFVGKGENQFIPLKPTIRVRRSFIHQPRILKRAFLVVFLIIVLSLLVITLTDVSESFAPNIKKTQPVKR